MSTKPLSKDELTQLAPHLHAQMQFMLTLGVATGFRISELLSITVAGCFENGGVRSSLSVARKHMKGKQQSRSVVLSQSLQHVLFQHISNLPPEQTFLFESRLGRLSRQQAWRLIKRAAASAKLQGNIATHSMRKTFAAKVHTAASGDLFITQQALGHASVNSTVKYLQLNSAKIDETILAAQEGV